MCFFYGRYVALKQVAFSLRRQNDRLDLLNHLRYRVSLNQATVLKRTYVHKTLQKFRENHFSRFQQSFGENEIRNKTKEQWAKRMMGTGNEISGEATKH